MRTSIPRVVVLVFWVLLFLSSTALAQLHEGLAAVSANESTARLAIQPKGSVFSIELSADSSSPLPATLTARVVGREDGTVSESKVSAEVSRSPRRFELVLDWTPKYGLDDASTNRLFYEVRLDSTGSVVCSGILSPAQLIPDIFELRFMGIDTLSLGKTYVARVWAVRPGSNKPVPGVAITGTFGDEDTEGDAKGFKATGRTNVRGEAVLAFPLPEGPGAVEDATIGLEIAGVRNNFKNSLTAELRFNRRAAILLSTDKPLYQTDQVLHMRALLLNDQRRAWAKHAVRFAVRDPDDTIVYSSDTQSSTYGIASAEWSIPATQKLGTYRVSAEITGDDDNRDLAATQHVRLSRYDLPTFTVNVLPDQPYYLPGQNARLTISASYLFGKPVLRGHVRVLRESSRKWNYATQKWEAEEEVVQEGELDAKNEFQASIDLSKEHAALHEADWRRFDDIRYAAYVTDASSRRAQERHFDVRISRDDIHLYVLSAAGGLPSGLRPEFYVSASFADGTPAAANIVATLTASDPSDENVKAPSSPIAVVQVRTNRYGLAHIRVPVPVQSTKEHDSLYLVLDAKTLDGRAGYHLESYSLLSTPLRITPSRTILRPGDPIEADVESAEPQGRVRIELIDGETQSIVASQQIGLHGMRAHINFAGNPRYAGVLTLVAYPLDADYDRQPSVSQIAAASVLIPRSTRLQLDVKPAKLSYRPGDAASLSLRVRGIEGGPAQSAVGVLVYDQAIEELARTEASRSTGYEDRIDSQLGFATLPQHDDAIAGISIDDLLNRPADAVVPPDLELLAQALFSGRTYAPIRVDTSDRDHNFAGIFRKQISSTLDPVSRILQENFSGAGRFPSTEAELASILATRISTPVPLLDPWGRPYHMRHDYRWIFETIEFRSEGPDKTLDTDDDFVAYTVQRPFFERDAKHLRALIDAYHARTGAYVRDSASLQAAAAQEQTALETFVDPWGTPYRFEFEIVRENFAVNVKSAGPDKRFRAGPTDYTDLDDIPVLTFGVPYFREISQHISDALFADAKVSAHFPDNETEFIATLQRQGIDWNALRDPWNRPYYIVPTVEASYSDKITMRAYGQDVSGTAVPVTRTARGFVIMSEGPDLTRNTVDDFSLARFTSPFLDEPGGSKSLNAPPAQKATQPFYSGSSGAIRVSITDMTGAVISNAKVSATNEATNLVYQGNSNEQGICLVGNLPAGAYRILVESPGFRAYALTSIPVLSSNVTDLEVRLSVGAVSETVEVTAETVTLSTDAASLSLISRGVVGQTKSRAASVQINPAAVTPRLREYFPETLFWQPEVLTDRSGHTTVKVPLADSITTWKVSVVASTLDGHIATASTDLRAFLPFFAELDPPKVLTVGDEIHLPVTVRNYLEKPQSVTLEWAAEPWSQALSPLTTHVDVSAGDYAQKDFAFRAALPLKNAKQRLTAHNRSSLSDSDAIEKKLRVHADGQEHLAQASSFFTGNTTMTLDIPSSALAGSIEAELVLYSNPIAHVTDSIEAIMERPYGCAEQTISSAYPSLIWLQLQKSRKLPASPLDARARRYLNLAYAKLLGYREPGGGVTYWGKGNPRVSLTAYALRFLTEAGEFIDVDPGEISVTRAWLLRQADSEGGFREYDWNGKPSDVASPYLTAYVIRALALDLDHRTPAEKGVEPERQAVRKAIDYLAANRAAITGPYDVALTALAKLAVHEDASSEISSLLAAQHAESQGTYWDLQHNTIFYGWGHTGRIETTAIVIDALASAKRDGHASPEIDSALSRGTLFLLQNKDRYGVWYSTQATVNVLQALVRQLSAPGGEAPKAVEAARLLIDGKPGPELSASADLRQLTPQRADLSAFLSPGKHTLTIEMSSNLPATAYENVSYYLPWSDAAVSGSTVRSGDAESLRYAIQFDRTAAGVGDSIRCTVHSERVGFRGYGMMLAEVGLPPGADVDRDSLDAAVESAGWDVQSYEVQPDRVVFYLWPRAGGTTFSFRLKPRFAMSAATAESVLYDYYNPEARASVPPAHFAIAPAAPETTAAAASSAQAAKPQ